MSVPQPAGLAEVEDPTGVVVLLDVVSGRTVVVVSPELAAGVVLVAWAFVATPVSPVVAEPLGTVDVVAPAGVVEVADAGVVVVAPGTVVVAAGVVVTPVTVPVGAAVVVVWTGVAVLPVECELCFSLVTAAEPVGALDPADDGALGAELATGATGATAAAGE